jgi:DNA-binding CsgD family transcriptional regulator/biotin operon repressor
MKLEAKKPHKHFESVRRLYVDEGKTLMEIAKILGIAFRTVQSITSKNNMISARRNGRDETNVRKMVNEGKTNREIAEILGCSKSTVSYLRIKYGINSGVDLKKIITKEFLERKYLLEKNSAIQIAKEVGCSSSTVEKNLKKHGIKLRENKGRYAETAVLDKLLQLGYKVEDMNEKDPFSVYDLKLNDRIRIEVKSAKINKSGYGQIALLNPPDLTLTDYRVKLSNGYTRKLFWKTCDFMILLVDFKRGREFYVVPSGEIPDELKSICFSEENPNDYYKFLNKWDLLEKSDAPTSDVKKK